MVQRQNQLAILVQAQEILRRSQEGKTKTTLEDTYTHSSHTE